MGKLLVDLAAMRTESMETDDGREASDFDAGGATGLPMPIPPQPANPSRFYAQALQSHPHGASPPSSMGGLDSSTLRNASGRPVEPRDHQEPPQSTLTKITSMLHLGGHRDKDKEDREDKDKPVASLFARLSLATVGGHSPTPGSSPSPDPTAPAPTPCQGLLPNEPPPSESATQPPSPFPHDLNPLKQVAKEAVGVLDKALDKVKAGLHIGSAHTSAPSSPKASLPTTPRAGSVFEAEQATEQATEGLEGLLDLPLEEGKEGEGEEDQEEEQVGAARGSKEQAVFEWRLYGACLPAWHESLSQASERASPAALDAPSSASTHFRLVVSSITLTLHPLCSS